MSRSYTEADLLRRMQGRDAHATCRVPVSAQETGQTEREPKSPKGVFLRRFGDYGTSAFSIAHSAAAPREETPILV